MTTQQSPPSSQTIKVIGAGFGRTGTLSLKEALNILGYKCYHWQELMQKNIPHSKLWSEAYDGKLADFDLIFKYSKKELETDPYTATVDWPSTTVYEKLMIQYPDAKVILTLRDGESWYKSMLSTLYRVSHEFPIRYIVPRQIYNMGFKLIWTGTFHNRFLDKQYAIGIYNRHNQMVQQTVPKDRLLVLDLSKNTEGWKPLCEFLNVAVPTDGRAFPRLNDMKKIEKMLKLFNRIGWSVIGIVSTVVIGAITACVLRYM
ncbi:unnamed protein product [Didymodactylos carnosus]|uniref:Sulfotransferase n=1 Tax=Didymodactylos carnosus TaxID=1234261 RepID=A0A814QZ31_9BILA|nr:unnamed protein product [Didymodactylos carnosus]CAF1385432.1 unnamed protein product [Didymodactylos carnosus]CAF3890074.1 unnamed protein product [Didymodactylos carnosus]CAF4193548.1 unnamed protein product [Didymodactylos carnosus]